MYTLDQLTAFVTTCEYGSVSAAARKLKRAQSGISQAITNLEIELNQPLFERSRNAMKLTDKGNILLPIARNLLQQSQILQQKAAALSEPLLEDQLIIAFEESLANDEILAIFKKLAKQFPFVHVDIRMYPNNEIYTAIEKGDISLGLCYQMENSHTNLYQLALHLHQKNFIVMTNRMHPLAQLSTVSIDDLKQHIQLLHYEQKTPISPLYWRCDNYYALYALVEQGVGWAILPEQLTKHSGFPGELKQLKLSSWLNEQKRQVLVLIAHNHQQGRVTRFLLDKLQGL